jgi:hypothetical protein
MLWYQFKACVVQQLASDVSAQNLQAYYTAWQQQPRSLATTAWQLQPRSLPQ